ncbi:MULTISPECIES: hypothetical protein [unclassified Streptomyces]|uniref:hypothetical protein n=1 Tax=unclassified Streptomyces TaxID=2593676 RepID=UPI002E2B1A50|nr:hypothetical protein [Streptomyces sp. NBC_00223]
MPQPPDAAPWSTPAFALLTVVGTAGGRVHPDEDGDEDAGQDAAGHAGLPAGSTAGEREE